MFVFHFVFSNICMMPTSHDVQFTYESKMCYWYKNLKHEYMCKCFFRNQNIVAPIFVFLIILQQYSRGTNGHESFSEKAYQSQGAQSGQVRRRQRVYDEVRKIYKHYFYEFIANKVLSSSVYSVHTVHLLLRLSLCLIS